jgi:hypothetical protein
MCSIGRRWKSGIFDTALLAWWILLAGTSVATESHDGTIASNAEGDWAGGAGMNGQSACEPCGAPGTLMQWSYGTGEGGGPDVSEPLVTDRPDFTEASVTVGRGVSQFEMGYTYFFDDDGGEPTIFHSYPELLVRVGILADWFELRIAWNHATEKINGLETSGSLDMLIGCKLALTPQEGILPEMAIVPQMTVPSGSDAFTFDDVMPGVNWLYGWDIHEGLSTGGSTQFIRSRDDGTQETFYLFAQSWTVGYSLTEKLGAYTEWFALLPSGADTVRPEHYFDGGFTYLLSNNVQWDIRGGVGLNNAAVDYFIGTGLSVRIP